MREWCTPFENEINGERENVSEYHAFLKYWNRISENLANLQDNTQSKPTKDSNIVPALLPNITTLCSFQSRVHIC